MSADVGRERFPLVAEGREGEQPTANARGVPPSPTLPHKGGESGRTRLGLAMLFLVAVVGAVAALALYAASLPPLDLTEATQRSAVVLDRNDRLLRAFTTEEDRWRLPTAAADVDPRYIRLLLAYEDRRFRRHGGVDPLAMLRAATQLLTHGRVVSGGSTLTMQVARLVEGRDGKGLGAKLRQAVRAVELERRLTKDEILTLYLNLAPFGGNLEGLRAASFAWLGKEPARLSLGEAALLVAIPQSPETRRPDRAPDTARRARDRVLDRAAAAHLFPAAEIERARAETTPTERKPFPALAPQTIDTLAEGGAHPPTQRLTLDLGWQRTLEALAAERLVGLEPRLSAAIVVAENATGEIRASVGGADYASRARAGSLDLTRAIRSPGSALKPFVYALAFEEGLAHPETLLEDRPSRFGGYAPENFDLSFQGVVTARRALQQSLNVPAVDLLAALGPQRFLTRLRAAGATVLIPPDSAPGLSVALGGLGLSLRDMAALYVALARGGDSLPLTLDRAAAHPPSPRTLVDPVAAWYVADILRGAPAPANAPQGRLAFKTGTSYGYRDAWAVGFDRRHTIAVWVGRADNAAVPGLVGRAVAAPLLFDAFARIGLDPEPFPRPANALVATTATLPPPLQHLRGDAPKTPGVLAQAALKIAFPPAGADLELGAVLRGEVAAVPLKAQGGAPPLVWLVDGKPLGAPDRRHVAAWTPGGMGFAEISVIDARGATDSVTVRVR